MRRFSSYGPVDPEIHYYAPRNELIERAYTQLRGDFPKKGGHYFTVWAPRQCGKTWLMQQILFRMQKEAQFNVLKINLEHLKYETDTSVIIDTIAKEMGDVLHKDFAGIDTQAKFQEIFRRDVLDKPLILILDEFDALAEEAINVIVSTFRNIYIKRADEMDKAGNEKSYLLHAVSLIGVRSVLGIENQKGSPFNIQRSIHVPNLTFNEVEGMFKWYEKESGQKVESEVIRQLYDEVRGQPGLTCWLGELLTEGFEDYRNDISRPIDLDTFKFVYTTATVALPNNNILNLISKAKKETNQTLLLEMFKTGEKLEFTFDEPTINDLYMNGLVDKELEADGRYYLRFSCPLVQKRIFNYFSHTFFRQVGELVDPYIDMEEVITDAELKVRNLLKLYQTYLDKNKDWLFKSAPRRTDMRIYEAIFHFNLYSYLNSFLKAPGGRVFPEFPTGNGKIDLILTYKNNRYGLELKSFTNRRDYKVALEKAALYGSQLQMAEIFLVFFVQYIDKENKRKLETVFTDENSGVSVIPVFIATGE